MKWKKGKIKIITYDKSHEMIDGVIYGHLGVHRIVGDREFYTITHLHSGLKMPKKISSYKNAKLIAERIHKFPLIGEKDLRKLPKKEFNKLGDLFHKSFKEIDN